MSDRYEFEMDEWDMDRPENVVYVVGLGPGDVSYPVSYTHLTLPTTSRV